MTANVKSPNPPAPLYLDTRVSLSPAEAAAAAGVGKVRIYQEIDAGRLPARKLGARTMILTEDLRQWARGLPPIGSASDAA
jgi:excisionase family DNA binding protein